LLAEFNYEVEIVKNKLLYFLACGGARLPGNRMDSADGALPKRLESIFLITPARPDSLFNVAVRRIGNDLNGVTAMSAAFYRGAPDRPNCWTNVTAPLCAALRVIPAFLMRIIRLISEPDGRS